jgi:riboflavin biosynthesis pyrimidine reductase
MDAPVTQLYPAPQQQLPLQGLYLAHRLHTRGQVGKPFVYSNFITSLDGRIATASAGRNTHSVPEAIANSRDWRLYQELAGQAGVLVTSGRFFRQAAMGEAQDQLPVGNQPAYSDIRDWRIHEGLSAQPDIAIMSSSLEIPLEALEPYRQRRIIVVTGAAANQAGIETLRANGIEVIFAGSDTKVEGRLMIEKLAESGYQSIYAIAGPAVFHTLLKAGVIDRLYLTISQHILGGTRFDTLTQGEPLNPAQGMRLAGLYHDAHGTTGADQLLGFYEPGS